MNIAGIQNISQIKQAERKEVNPSAFLDETRITDIEAMMGKFEDGVGKIVMESDITLEQFFDEIGINYEIPADIDYSMWLKYTLNLFSNQTSAVLNMTFGEMKRNKHFIDFAKKIIAEVRQVANKKGISNLDNLEKDSLNALSFMCDEGKTSMLQDILSKKNTEAEVKEPELSNTSTNLDFEKDIPNLLDHLNAKEQAVIRMKYGIGYESELSSEEIQAALGMSAVKFRKTEAAAIRKLQFILSKRYKNQETEKEKKE